MAANSQRSRSASEEDIENIATMAANLAIESPQVEELPCAERDGARELLLRGPLREVFENSYLIDYIKKFVLKHDLYCSDVQTSDESEKRLCRLCGKDYYLPELKLQSKELVFCDAHDRTECVVCDELAPKDMAGKICNHCTETVCSKCPTYTCYRNNEHRVCEYCFEDMDINMRKCDNDNCDAMECMSTEGCFMTCVHCDTTRCDHCTDEVIFYCDKCENHHVCENCDDLTFCEGCDDWYCPCTDTNCDECNVCEDCDCMC